MIKYLVAVLIAAGIVTAAPANADRLVMVCATHIVTVSNPDGSNPGTAWERECWLEDA